MNTTNTTLTRAEEEWNIVVRNRIDILRNLFDETHVPDSKLILDNPSLFFLSAFQPGLDGTLTVGPDEGSQAAIILTWRMRAYWLKKVS